MDQSWSAIKVTGVDLPSFEQVLRGVNNYGSFPNHAKIVTYKGCWLENVSKITDTEILKCSKILNRGFAPLSEQEEQNVLSE